MSSLHRILWMDAQIRAGRYPGCRDLMEQFEISRRQAVRDIAYLRDSLGAPITYDALRRGYCYFESSFALPSVFLSQEQAEALRHASAHYRVLEEETGTALSGVFQRLADMPSAPETAVHTLEPQTAVVRLDIPAMAKLLPLRTEPLGDGMFRLHYFRPALLMAALIACPCRVTIESPAWLRNQIKHRLRKLLNDHSG